MGVDAKLVMKLRQATGAGIMDCKKALAENNEDFDKAAEYLQIKKKAKAAKKADRIAAEGTVKSYIHMGGKIGVLVEINCETDFAAKSDPFQNLSSDIAMHIAAMNPTTTSTDETSAADIEAQRAIFTAQAIEEGIPEQHAHRAVEGKVEKWMKEGALLEQKFVKDPSKTVKEHLLAVSGDIGEKLSIRRFVRYELGAGLEKRQDNLADEVAATIAGG
jgi:elongation factor Ts